MSALPANTAVRIVRAGSDTGRTGVTATGEGMWNNGTSRDRVVTMDDTGERLVFEGWMLEEIVEPTVGAPASIKLHTYTRAAVITKVTAKTVTVQRVETGPSEPDMACDPGAYGVRPMRATGILDHPIEGTDQTFRWSAKRNAFMHDGLRLILGHSTEWIDYRD
jgi:hypothetical protein